MNFKRVNKTDFQSIILNLQYYWSEVGCVILQPYDNEVGAGTFHPATTLRSLGPGFGGSMAGSDGTADEAEEEEQLDDADLADE